MDRNFIDYRLSYSKLGLMKFIGHIDTMKLFHKIFRMSGLPTAFSQGFNPHQIFTIAHPLALGMEGRHELADFRLNAEVSVEEIIACLNERTPSGLQIIGVRKLAQGEKNCAALVAAADYTVELDNASPKEALQQAVSNILAKTEMVVSKRTKSGTSQADIRPDIMDISVGAESINMRISAGSAANLKPQLVVQEIFREAVGADFCAAVPYNEYAQRYTRTQLFYRNENGLTQIN